MLKLNRFIHSSNILIAIFIYRNRSYLYFDINEMLKNYLMQMNMIKTLFIIYISHQ